VGTIITSALVAHTGWHWMLDRADRLRQYHIEWPTMTPLLLLILVRWTIGIVAVAAAVWLAMNVAAALKRTVGREARRANATPKSRRHEEVI
jgi:hypothetical protein